MVKVLIVEDQRLSRENMENVVNKLGEEYSIVASITDATLAPGVCEREKVDLVLMDVCTSGRMDGIEAAGILKEKHPGIRIIIMTSMFEVGYPDRARKAGADSFWYKDVSDHSLREMIQRTMEGESIYPDKPRSVRLGKASSDDLTSSEIGVLRLVCEGMDYHEIAARLHITEHTVKAHISHILQKTGYPNKIRLAIAVTNKNFIIPRNLEQQEEE